MKTENCINKQANKEISIHPRPFQYSGYYYSSSFLGLRPCLFVFIRHRGYDSLCEGGSTVGFSEAVPIAPKLVIFVVLLAKHKTQRILSRMTSVRKPSKAFMKASWRSWKGCSPGQPAEGVGQ